MTNYPLFLSNFTTFAYIPLSFLYIWPVQKWGSAITPEMEALPKSAFLYIGALDSLSGIMQTLSINYIQNGTLVVLVMQLAIPISMIISRFMLNAKYRLSQIIGCVVVAAGLAVVLVPTFLEKKTPDECASEISPATLGISILVLVLSNIPMCLSTVVKEKTLGEAAIDPIYLNGWVAVFQFIIGIPLMIPAAPTVNVSIKDIPQINGAKCYFGTNSIVKPETLTGALAALGSMYTAAQSATSAVVPASDRLFSERTYQVAMSHATHTLTGLGECDNTEYDDCAMAPIYVNVYICFNVVYNILIILLVKYGSANLLWMAMTVMVPFSSIAFSLDFMPKHKPLKTKDIIGLIVILAGLIIYRFYTQIRQAIFGKTIADIAEEQQRIEEEAQSKAINSNAINSSVPVPTYDEDFENGLSTSRPASAPRPSSLTHTDSYVPPSMSDYTEAQLAPGVDVNSNGKSKVKKGKKASK